MNRRRLFLAAFLAVVLAFSAGAPLSEEALCRDWGSFVPPWLAYKAVMALTTAVDQLRNAIVPPQIRVAEHSMAFARTEVIHILAALRIPDVLADGPQTATQLADRLGVPSPEVLWRVLRLAVAQGLLAGVTDRAGDTRFRNNALSATLRASHPSSVRDFVMLQGQEMMPAWRGLLPALRSGKEPWAEARPAEAAAGRDFWSYLHANPPVEELFSRAMANADAMGVKAVLADYRWSHFDRFIDVGGALGSFLAILLERHPTSAGVLFDLPQVVERAREQWQSRHTALLPRTDFHGGSFLDPGAVPAARGQGDVYVMRVILHDWRDDKAAAILRNVRAAIGESKATLALLELAPADGLAEQYEGIVYMDVQMLAVCDGRERSQAQWEALFAESGFRLSRIWPTRGTLKVVEAQPI